MFDAIVIIGIVTLAIYTIVDRICRAKENCAVYHAMARYSINNTDFGDLSGAAIKNIMDTICKTKEK